MTMKKLLAVSCELLASGSKLLPAPSSQLPARSGQALIEVVVATGLIVLFAATFAKLTLGSHSTGRQGREQTIATFYAQEGIEAARSIAERDFDELVVAQHGVAVMTGAYAFSGSSNISGKYTRTITVAEVERDGNDDIVASGGTVDEDTRQITSSVTWTVFADRTNTVNLVTYFTRWFSVLANSWLLDLLAEFQTGFFNSTETTDAGDGGVQLKGRGDLSSDLASHMNLDPPSDKNILSVHVDPAADRLYYTTQVLAGGDEFFAYDISQVSSGILSFTGSTDLGAESKGFALYPSTGSGQATIAFTITSHNDQEVRIVSLTGSNAFTVVSTWNLASDGDKPNGIAVDDTAQRGYVASDDGYLYVFDTSNPYGGLSMVGTADLSGKKGKGVALYPEKNATYAYVITDDSSGELMIVDTSNLATVTTCNFVADNKPTAIHIVGDRLFIGRENSTYSEFIEFAINPSDPDNCTYMNDNVTGEEQLADDAIAFVLAPAFDLAFVLLNQNNNELQIVDTSGYGSVNQVNLSGNKCEAIAFLGDYVYAGCKDNTDTLQILKGGGGGSAELIFTEGLQGGWTLADNGGNVSDADNDADNQFLVRTGSESLWVNPAASGYTEFQNSYTTSASGSLDFYVNSVSPWSFGVYGDNGGSVDASSSIVNATYGSAYQTNDEEGAFTDFPVADYAAMKVLAQSTSSYINAGGSNLTLDTDDLTTYSGKLIYVEFSSNKRTLTIDFNNDAGGSFTASIVMQGGKQVRLQNYNGATLSSASSSYPVLASDKKIVFNTNSSMTVNGLLFTENRIDSSKLGGANAITINGSVIASTVNNKLERANITYTTDYHTSPPTHFSPTYSGQDFSVQASAGDAVNVSSYATIDDDVSTWQLVSIPLSDMDIESTAILYVRLTDAIATDQPTVFLDDVQWVIAGATSSANYPVFGTYTSPFFDSGTGSTTWSQISWTESGEGNLYFRIRTASSTGALKQSVWVGSGGTMETSYTDPSGEDIVTDPGVEEHRVAQWKAYFSGSGTVTPVLEDVTLTYE